MTIILNGSTGVSTPAVTDASGGNTSTINGVVVAVDNYIGMRNRIINGAMMIDQRNAGASITPANGAYGVDRWQFNASAASKFTAQRVTDAPTGFGYSLKLTSSSAYTAGASELFATMQPIEGFNFYDLSFGSVSAKTVTISFWVKSSLTGTFGGSLSNYAQNRFYPFSYTISSANTWEQKSVTISGDTSGTWVGASNAGTAYLFFSIGCGATISQTAGAWTASSGYSATGATSVVGTNGATFYITGVQLEVGSVATPFERRPYGTELALCQRYYYRATVDNIGDLFGNGFSETTSIFNSVVFFPVEMRTSPTALEQTGTAGDYEVYTGNTQGASTAVPTFFVATKFNASTRFTRTSSLTAGNGGCSRGLSATAYLGWSAEL